MTLLTTAFAQGTHAARPAAAAGNEGYYYFETDTQELFQSTGSAWVQVASVGGGGGGVTSPLTTKGDLWGFDTTDDRIPIGSNGQVLTADSGQALGAKWADLPTTITANNQTGTTYTPVLADAGNVIELNNAAAITLTIPPNSSVAFPVGTVVELWQQGAGQVTVAAGAGVTLRSPGGKTKLAAQYASAVLRQRATDEWCLEGDIST